MRSAGTHGSLGVVLVSDGGAEQGDDAVAEQLVDAPTELLDVGDEPLEARFDQALDLLGVAVLGKCGVSDQVGEQDRDDASFLRRGRSRPTWRRHSWDRSAPPSESAGRTRRTPSWPWWHATALDPSPASGLMDIHPRTDDPEGGAR